MRVAGYIIRIIGIVEQVGSQVDKLLFQRSGDQGNVWRHAHASVPAVSQGAQFTLKFVATTGKSYEGDIAIDDLTMTDGGCSYGVCNCHFYSQNINVTFY